MAETKADQYEKEVQSLTLEFQTATSETHRLGMELHHAQNEIGQNVQSLGEERNLNSKLRERIQQMENMQRKNGNLFWQLHLFVHTTQKSKKEGVEVI